jgi:hypothetical protein
MEIWWTMNASWNGSRRRMFLRSGHFWGQGVFEVRAFLRSGRFWVQDVFEVRAVLRSGRFWGHDVFEVRAFLRSGRFWGQGVFEVRALEVRTFLRSGRFSNFAMLYLLSIGNPITDFYGNNFYILKFNLKYWKKKTFYRSYWRVLVCFFKNLTPVLKRFPHKI